jgi:hypothetical protein
LVFCACEGAAAPRDIAAATATRAMRFIVLLPILNSWTHN